MLEGSLSSTFPNRTISDKKTKALSEILQEYANTKKEKKKKIWAWDAVSGCALKLKRFAKEEVSVRCCWNTNSFTLGAHNNISDQTP